MPFDALVMRGIETRLTKALVNHACVRVQCGPDRLLFHVKNPHGEPFHLLTVLAPGVQRIHRTSRTTLASKKATPPWLSNLLPFTIRAVEVPPFERVITLTVESLDDWGEPMVLKLIIELAGHLTNVVLTDENNLVVDAWRKIAPGRPGRQVWPKFPYEPPPRVANPLNTRDLADLSPWARRWLTEGGGTWEQLARDFQQGFPGPGFTLHNRSTEEVWVYPQAGYHSEPAPDLEQALDAVFDRRERQNQEAQLKRALLSQIESRIAHLGNKLSDYSQSREQDEQHWKVLGDLWLTHQYAFKADPSLTELTVEDYQGRPMTLTLGENETPAGHARDAYRQYKKIRARKEALNRLIPLLARERQELEAFRDEVRAQSHPLDWYKSQIKRTARAPSEAGERQSFRHFQSLHGLDIWVGRNREENADLTFHKARPDDIWLHTKQAPGSHVILSCGKTDPAREDLLDAAELAVFFSAASASSHVPVDYTRRKFVRKRPHAEPGQVLYQREKTLYITPAADRLRRLGAISEKLVGD